MPEYKSILPRGEMLLSCPIEFDFQTRRALRRATAELSSLWGGELTDSDVLRTLLHSHPWLAERGFIDE